MAEWVRWCDQGGGAPQGVRELLDAASPLKSMPPQTHLQALARATELASVQSVSALALLGGKAVVTAVACGTICTAVAAAAVQRGFENRSLPAATPAVTSPAKPQQTDRAASRGISDSLRHEPSAEPTQVPDAAVKVEDLPLQRAVASSRKAVRAMSSPNRDFLAVETRLVERARASLVNDPALALRLGQEYAERFPRGQLRSANQCLIVEALQRLGRTDEARARAGALVDEEPQGLYAERVRRLAGTE
jgi:hypothetical protein